MQYGQDQNYWQQAVILADLQNLDIDSKGIDMVL